MLELSNLPPRTEYQTLVSFFNSHVPQGIRYIKLMLINGTDAARLTVNAADTATILQSLSGQQVAPGYPLTITTGSSAGRALSNQERQALQAVVRNSYIAPSKSLDLSSLSQKGNFNFVNFQSQSFTSDLLNAIQQIAPDAVSINLANNQIQTLTTLTGMVRVAPNLENLSLQQNMIAK